MTISSTANRTSTAGDGTVTAFTFPYLFFNANDLVVILVTDSTGAEVIQEITTHYTVTGAGIAAGGTVTMGTAPPSGKTLVIIRREQFTQTLDLVENDPFPSDLIEQQFDTLTMLTQQLNTEIDRSVKLADGDTSGATTTLPSPVSDAFIKWNADGSALTTSSVTSGQSLGANGTVAAPYYSYTSDPDSGTFRIGANNLGVGVNGAKVLDIGTSGLSVTGSVTASGAVSVDDTTDSTSATSGSIHTDGGVGVAGKLFVAGTSTLIGVTTHGGDVLSDTDSTDSLGSTGVRWLKLWVDSIQTTADTDIAGDLTVTGDLIVNGTTVTNDATNTEIKDPLIELNSGAGSNANDLGLIMERGSTGNNAVILWDESGDFFTVGTTTATADSTGNMTYAFAPFKCSALTATSGTLAGLTSLAMSAGATLTAGFLDEDNMASNSAVAGVTQQSVKAYVDGNAPENGVKFAFETATTDTDQGVGKVWLNNATLASATVLYIDDVEAGGVSVNAWVDTFDDVTNAVARGYVYLAKYGTTNALVVYKVTGAVTSASTYSKVAVTHVVTIGSFSDGDDVGLTFVSSGADGAGDLASANNLSDVASATTSATNLGLGTGDSPQFTAVNIGAATDTTITRVSAGVIAVEGTTILDTADIGVAVQAFDADTLKADVDDTLTAGFGATDDNDGTKSSGTYTPTYAGGNFKLAVNGGAHTLAPQSGTGNIVIQYTNNGSAGTITTSGWTIVTGDDLTTTDGHDFLFFCTVVAAFKHLNVVALQ